MGYYTDYTLTFEIERGRRDIVYRVNDIVELLKEIKKMNVFTDIDTSNESASKILEAGGSDWGFDENLRWYEHDEDMAMLSAMFPGILFTLHGVGEDSEDLWYSYYKDGKVQCAPANIVFDDFDESKLKPIKFTRQRYSYEN